MFLTHKTEKISKNALQKQNTFGFVYYLNVKQRKSYAKYDRK